MGFVKARSETLRMSLNINEEFASPSAIPPFCVGDDDEIDHIESLHDLPYDVLLRIVDALPIQHRFVYSLTSHLPFRLLHEAVLWREIDLTQCSSCVTDDAVSRIIQCSNQIHSLILRPPASPPNLTWKLLQGLAAQASTRTLRKLVLHGCSGLISNTPKHLRPHISEAGVRCRLPALLSFKSISFPLLLQTPQQSGTAQEEEQAAPVAPAHATPLQTRVSDSRTLDINDHSSTLSPPAPTNSFQLHVSSVYAEWVVCQPVGGLLQLGTPLTCFTGTKVQILTPAFLGLLTPVDPPNCSCTPRNSEQIHGKITLVWRGEGKFMNVAQRCEEVLNLLASLVQEYKY